MALCRSRCSRVACSFIKTTLYTAPALGLSCSHDRKNALLLGKLLPILNLSARSCVPMRDVPFTPVVLLDGSRESQTAISHSPFTVGRMPGSDLLLEYPYVSRKHAEILFEDN